MSCVFSELKNVKKLKTVVEVNLQELLAQIEKRDDELSVKLSDEFAKLAENIQKNLFAEAIAIFNSMSENDQLSDAEKYILVFNRSFLLDLSDKYQPYKDWLDNLASRANTSKLKLVA